MINPTKTPLRERVRKILPGSNLAAFIVALFVAVFGALFVATYAIAMGDPQPRNIPFALVGDSGKVDVRDALGSATGTSFTFTGFDSEEAAVAAINEQKSYGALVDLPEMPPKLIISSASGASIARVIEADGDKIAATLDIPVTVTDINPLSLRDPFGLVISTPLSHQRSSVSSVPFRHR